MQATIKASVLATALGIQGVSVRTAIPVLKYARIDADNGTIQTTDMERMTTAKSTMSGGGVFLLPIEQTRGFASRMQSGADIQISVDGLTAKLTSGRARATMESLDPVDFPSMNSAEGGESFTIDGAAFTSMLSRVEAFVSNEETRYYLCGVFLEARAGKLTVTATNGNVLSTYTASINFTGDCKAIIPTTTIAIIKKIATGPMKITIHHNLIEFETSSSRVVSKVIEGDFPDYERVMAKGGERIEFKSPAMRDAIALIDASSDDAKNGAKLSIEGDTIEISGVDGTSRASTSVDCASDAVKCEFGCNYKYMADALRSIADGAVMTITDSISPIGLFDADDPGLRITMMPLRV